MAQRYAKAKAFPASPSSVDNADYDTVGEPIEDRFCPDSECEPRGWLVKRKYQGRSYATCSNNHRKGSKSSSCSFTANIFGPERGGESKLGCYLCSVPVVDVLSLGTATGKTDPNTNKPLYDNVHLFFDECAGRRAKDPTGKIVFTRCTEARDDIIGRTCAAFDPDKHFEDLKRGCTGEIEEGQPIVRSWALRNPPQGLHLRCAKRMHEDLVQGILREKKYRRASGVSAEEESKAPSFVATDDLSDL